MRKWSSFLGSRGKVISTRSTESEFASSMAYLATLDRFPAISRNGVSPDTNTLIRSAIFALFSRGVRMDY